MEKYGSNHSAVNIYIFAHYVLLYIYLLSMQYTKFYVIFPMELYFWVHLNYFKMNEIADN